MMFKQAFKMFSIISCLPFNLSTCNCCYLGQDAIGAHVRRINKEDRTGH